MQNFEAAITPATRAIFLETMGNPNSNLIPLEEVAAIAHRHGIPLVVDNTFGTPCLIRPIEHGAGSIFTIELEGGQAEAHRFIDRLKLFSLLANVADAKSLVIHPASTTHSQLTPEECAQQGITPGTVRLSIGLEHIDDLLEDLRQALDAI